MATYDHASMLAALGIPPVGAPPARTWIPIDVKLHWFSFLSVPDLARASRVCKSWTSLAQKTCDAQFAILVGAAMPALARAAKLRLLDRLQHAYLPENMAYLLSWAAGCRGACECAVLREICSYTAISIYLYIVYLTTAVPRRSLLERLRQGPPPLQLSSHSLAV